MTTIHLLRTPHASFVPATNDDTFLMARFAAGKVYRMDLVEMRNGRFFRKWWILAQVAFDVHSETMPDQDYQGVKVLADFERFRKDLTIMAGFFRPVWNARGELRLEPESLQWSKMTEERFDRLYSATINVVLQKILPGRGLDEAKLQAWVDRVMEFA